MDSTGALLFLMVVACFQTSDCLHSREKHIWETRVNATLAFLRNRPCWGLLRGVECDSTIPFNIADRKMSLYTAERSDDQAKLRTVLPDKKYRRLTDFPYQYDAVLVLDPKPDANFGHVVFVFLVNFDKDRTACARINGLHIYTGRDECMRIAKRRHCLNSLSNLNSTALRCETNFIPLVHFTDDQSMSQLLQCRQTLETRTFAKCRGLQALQTPPCSENSARCSPAGPSPPTHCTYEICDYAVLVSGGWNSFTSRPRYRTSLQKMWKFLHAEMHYRKRNIITFYGQGQKAELPRHQQRNAYAVDKADIVSKYIKDLCVAHPSCVDTFTLYLTGPSNSDGSLLFWDTTGKGLMTENGMLYTPKELFDDLKNCSAKRIFVVADYSYSGEMMHKLKSRMLRHRKQFRNMIFMSSASMGEYSLGSDFTSALINQSRTGNRIKCVREAFQEVKQEFSVNNALSTPEIAGENLSNTRKTFYGGRCNVTWEDVRGFSSCRLLNQEEWRPGKQSRE